MNNQRQRPFTTKWNAVTRVVQLSPCSSRLSQSVVATANFPSGPKLEILGLLPGSSNELPQNPITVCIHKPDDWNTTSLTKLCIPAHSWWTALVACGSPWSFFLCLHHSSCLLVQIAMREVNKTSPNFSMWIHIHTYTQVGPSWARKTAREFWHHQFK